jgi:hypothetical protein
MIQLKPLSQRLPTQGEQKNVDPKFIFIKETTSFPRLAGAPPPLDLNLRIREEQTVLDNFPGVGKL